MRTKEHHGNRVLQNDPTILRASMGGDLGFGTMRSGRSVAEATLGRLIDRSALRIWDELDALLHELVH